MSKLAIRKLNEEKQRNSEYQAAFKSRAWNNAVFRDSGIMWDGDPHPFLDVWDKTIRTSDVRLKAKINRKKNKLSVEIYIIHDDNLFAKLQEKENKSAIEKATDGLTLEWVRKDKSKRRTNNWIITFKDGVNIDDDAQWEEQHDWMINTMLKMYEAFKIYL